MKTIGRALTFCQDIFTEGELAECVAYTKGKYVGIAVSIEKSSKTAKRKTITNDLDTIADMAAYNDFEF